MKYLLFVPVVPFAYVFPEPKLTGNPIDIISSTQELFPLLSILLFSCKLSSLLHNCSSLSSIVSLPKHFSTDNLSVLLVGESLVLCVKSVDKNRLSQCTNIDGRSADCRSKQMNNKVCIFKTNYHYFVFQSCQLYVKCRQV